LKGGRKKIGKRVIKIKLTEIKQKCQISQYKFVLKTKLINALCQINAKLLDIKAGIVHRCFKEESMEILRTT
jgi:hypothetical protein